MIGKKVKKDRRLTPFIPNLSINSPPALVPSGVSVSYRIGGTGVRRFTWGREIWGTETLTSCRHMMSALRGM